MAGLSVIKVCPNLFKMEGPRSYLCKMQSLFWESYATTTNSPSNPKLGIFLECLGRRDSMELR